MRYHLAKALEAIWYTAMGGFLGLAGGLVVAIIIIFKGAEKIAASPGVAPFNDPAFTAFSHQSVAGFTGQMLFKVGGLAALVLLGLATLALVMREILIRSCTTAGTRGAGLTRAIALAGALLFMGLGTTVTLRINSSWPGLYDTAATTSELNDRRAAFDRLHQRSERVVTIAWLCGLVAIGVSPWCRETAGPNPSDPAR